jgi:hypothetical protein
MSLKIKKNLIFDALHDLLVEDLCQVAWISKGIVPEQIKNTSHVEGSLYISELLFLVKSGVVCPNILTGMIINLGFSVKDFNDESHLELTDLLCDLSSLLATDRYKNLGGLGQLSVQVNPRILAGQRQAGSRIQDYLLGVVSLKFTFN